MTEPRWDAWDAQEPAVDFADRVMASLPGTSPAPTAAHRTPSRGSPSQFVRIAVFGGALAASFVAGLQFRSKGSRSHGVAAVQPEIAQRAPTEAGPLPRAPVDGWVPMPPPRTATTSPRSNGSTGASSAPPPRTAQATRADTHPTTTAPAILELVSRPWGRVTIDGRAAGDTPLRISVAPGPHVIVVTNPDLHAFAARTIRVDLRPGERSRHRIDFTAAASSSAPVVTAPAERRPTTGSEPATLGISVRPWGNVRIDGGPSAETPIRVSLPPGRHTVVVSNPDRQITRTLVVELAPGERWIHTIDLTR